MGAPLNEKWPSTGPRVLWRKPVGSGPQRAGRRRNAPDSVSSRRRSRGRRVVRCPHRRAAMAARVSDDLPRRFRIRRRPARRSRRRRRHRLHLRRRRKAARDRSRNRESRCGTSTRCGSSRSTKGFFGAAGSPLVEGGKVIANVGGKKARHRGVRRENGKSDLDGDDGCRELFVRRRRDDPWPTLRRVPDAGRIGRPRSRERAGPVSAAVAGAAGGVGERSHAARRRQQDFRVGRVRPRRRCAAIRWDEARRRVAVE